MDGWGSCDAGRDGDHLPVSLKILTISPAVSGVTVLNYYESSVPAMLNEGEVSLAWGECQAGTLDTATGMVMK